LFSRDAIEALAAFSGGVPRLINTLADNALFEGFLAEERPVDAALVVEAAQQLGLERVDAEAERSAGSDGQPDWLDSLVPPAETDFEGSLEVEHLSPQAPEIDASSGEASKLDEGEFSMGSIVREIEADDEPDEPEEPEEAESADGGESGEDWDFSIVTERGTARREKRAPSEPLDEDDDPVTCSAVVEEAGDGEFDPSSLLDPDDAEAAEPDTSGTLDGFDPGSMLDDEIVEPVVAAAEEPEEEEVDLDALFDQIRVGD
jgi:hypothetical protein